MQKTDEILKKAAIWNTIAGMIKAGQSAIILIFVSRLMGINEAGIFTIAYAVANMALTFAMYGVRTFQVTDIKKKYSFSDYFSSRCITTIVTMIVIAGYVIFQFHIGHYNLDKVQVVFGICLWKMVDAVEDVFYGMYQQHGRLDIGAKCYTYRLMFSTTVFCVLSVFRISLIKVTLYVLLLSIVYAIYLIKKTFGIFQIRLNLHFNEKTMGIIKECFSLCVGSTLAVYIGNVPKFMIDQYMNAEVQAYFGYLMMPAFVIMVCNSFLYYPIIRSLGELWEARKVRIFVKRILKQYGVVCFLTVCVCIGGSTLGLPILSHLYGVDLHEFHTEFLILLIGGGVNALVTFIMVPLTTIRSQNCIASGFVLTSISSIWLGKWFVVNYGMFGAAMLYLVLNLILAVYLTICFFVKVEKEKQRIRYLFDIC